MTSVAASLDVVLQTADIDGLIPQTAVALPPSLELDPAPGWMRLRINGAEFARTYDTRVDQ